MRIYLTLWRCNLTNLMYYFKAILFKTPGLFLKGHGKCLKSTANFKMILKNRIERGSGHILRNIIGCLCFQPRQNIRDWHYYPEWNQWPKRDGKYQVRVFRLWPSGSTEPGSLAVWEKKKKKKLVQCLPSPSTCREFADHCTGKENPGGSLSQEAKAKILGYPSERAFSTHSLKGESFQ